MASNRDLMDDKEIEMKEISFLVGNPEFNVLEATKLDYEITPFYNQTKHRYGHLAALDSQITIQFCNETFSPKRSIMINPMAGDLF